MKTLYKNLLCAWQILYKIRNFLKISALVRFRESSISTDYQQITFTF